VAKTDYFEIIRDVPDKTFHVDSDCYLVFGGVNFFEKQPFIRIGASRYLPDVFKEQVRYIILNELNFGALWDEPDCLPADPEKKLTVIGSQNQIDIYLAFLTARGFDTHRFETIPVLPVSEKPVMITFDSEEINFKNKQDKKRVKVGFNLDTTVEFTKNKNIIIRTGKNILFDLNYRLRCDRNSFTETNELSDKYICKNIWPFYERGFILIDNKLAYYNKDWFFLSGTFKSLFNELMKANINPDRISTLYTDEPDEEYERIIRRYNERRAELTVITSVPEELGHYHDYYSVSRLHTELAAPGKEYRLKDTVFKINPRGGIMAFNPGEGIPAVEYHAEPSGGDSFSWTYDPGKKKSKHKKKKIPENEKSELVNEEQVRINTAGTASLPDTGLPSFLGDIIVIPESAIASVPADQNKVFLVYGSGASAVFSNSGLPSEFYKLYPYIDYRFSKQFKKENRLYYPVNFYLNDIITAQSKVISKTYGLFVEHIVKTVECYLAKTNDFTANIQAIIRHLQRMVLPRNKYEFLIIHNACEFLKYIHHVLEDRGILNIDVVDDVLQIISEIKRKSVDIEISDYNIKGNINKLPNGRIYVFYSISDLGQGYSLPRIHQILLQDKLANDRFLLNSDLERHKKAITRFSHEVNNPAIVQSANIEYMNNRKILNERLDYFDKEKDRMDSLIGFTAVFQKQDRKTQNRFFLAEKTKFGSLSEQDMDEQLFGDLADTFLFTKSITNRFISKEEKAARAKRKKRIALTAGIFILVSGFLLFNSPFRAHSAYRTVDSWIIDYPVLRKIYFADKIRKAFGIKTVVLSWDTTDEQLWTVLQYTDAEGNMISERVLNDDFFRRGGIIYEEELGKVVSQLLRETGAPDTGADSFVLNKVDKEVKNRALADLKKTVEDDLLFLSKYEGVLFYYRKWIETSGENALPRINIQALEMILTRAHEIKKRQTNEKCLFEASKVIELTEKIKASTAHFKNAAAE